MNYNKLFLLMNKNTTHFTLVKNKNIKHFYLYYYFHQEVVFGINWKNIDAMFYKIKKNINAQWIIFGRCLLDESKNILYDEKIWLFFNMYNIENIKYTIFNK